MFTKNKYLILMFVFSSMLFGNMIGSLGNKDIQISGFFFQSSKSVYFTSLSDENNFSIWEYNNDRKYRPIHNAVAFDGYEGAKGIFDGIIIDKDYQYARLSASSSDEYDYLTREKLDIVHILIKSSKHNLLINKDLSSVWEYLDKGGRKYRPIHNTDSFDGYNGAKKIFNSISLSDNSMKIRGINKNNYIEFKQKEHLINKTKAIKIINSQDYEANYQKIGDNIIKDKANDLIWFDDENITAVKHSQAKEYCENLEVGEYKDFRMPNILELMSLFDKNGKHKDIFNLYVFKKGSPNALGSFNSLNSFLEQDIRGYLSNEKNIRLGRKSNLTLDFYLVGDKTHSMRESIPSNFEADMGYIKCVQSESELSSPILVRDDEKEIVKDITNNLVWQDNLEVRMELNESLVDDYCKTNTLNDYANWNVPTLKEVLITPYNNHESGIVDDFYNWNSYYTFINDKLSTKAQKYIIDNTYQMLKDDTFNNSERHQSLSKIPKDIRDHILDILEFEKDTQALGSINISKEQISKDEKQIEITRENYKDITKKYENELSKIIGKDTPQEAIPSGVLSSNPLDNISISDNQFAREFFRNYFIGNALRRELSDELNYIYRIEDKESRLRRIKYHKDNIIFYQDVINAQNSFLSRKILKQSFIPNNFELYYFDNYLDINKRSTEPLGLMDTDGVFHTMQANTMIRKICIKRDNK